MKKLITIATIAIASASGFAQDRVSLSLGASLPTGDFSNSSGGGAKTGFAADLLFQHQTKGNSKLWLAGGIRYQSNGVDVSQIQNALPGSNISAKNWSAFTLLFGPLFSIDLSEKAAFEPRVLVGYMSAKTPAVTVNSGGSSFNFPSTTAGAFATALGVNFRFKTSDNVNTILGFDYLTANPKFTFSQGGSSQDANQQISSFNIMVGLSFKL